MTQTGQNRRVMLAQMRYHTQSQCACGPRCPRLQRHAIQELAWQVDGRQGHSSTGRLHPTRYGVKPRGFIRKETSSGAEQ